MIVVAGESLVDLLVSAGGEVAARPGGAPYNVARGVARLGGRVAFVGALSSDRFGRRLRAELVADGVDLSWAAASELPTTLALAELDEDGATYRFYAEGTAAAAFADAAAVPVPDVLYVGGLGLVLEPLASALESLVERVAGRALVVCDPNWRAAAIADPARQRRRLAAVLGACDVVKASVEDLERIAPGASADAAARGLLGGRTRCVLVTDGARPARAHARAWTVEAPPPAVAVVDTVGAGDAFCAAFLAWWTHAGLGREHLDERAQVERALAFAVEVAALACARRGADPPRATELGEPWRTALAP